MLKIKIINLFYLSCETDVTHKNELIKNQLNLSSWRLNIIHFLLKKEPTSAISKLEYYIQWSLIS